MGGGGAGGGPSMEGPAGVGAVLAVAFRGGDAKALL